MLKNILFPIIMLCALVLPANSQTKADKKTTSTSSAELSSIPSDPTVRKGVLPNGMTYYIKANKKPEHRAELRMAVKAGSMQEDPDQLGIAHLVEHMAFNGSRNFSKNELVNYLESIGSRFGPDLNAYTSFDETVYMLQVRTDEADHLDKGLLILRDWADGVSFEGEEIDKERGVVISEWRTGLSAEQRMQQEYLPLTFYKSRYAERLPIGDPEILKTVSYDAVRRFYKDWYRPELMAILVVGDIDVNAIEEKIKAQFASVQRMPNCREKLDVDFPVHEQTFARVITDPEATNSRVQLIYKHHYDPVKNLIDYRRQLHYTLYNRMISKRLSEIGRKADPPFMFAFSNYGQNVGDLGTYSSSAVAEPKNIRRAYKTLLEENQRVLLYGFTETELEREKAVLLRNAEQNVKELDKQESSRIVQGLVYHFLEGDPMPDAMQVLEMYKSMLPTITTTSINDFSKNWMTDRNRIVYITAPEKDLGLLPDSIELVRLLNESKNLQLDPYQDVDVSAPLLSGNFPARKVLDVTHDPVLNIYHWQFENGVQVNAKPTTFKNDEVLMNAYSPGGHSLYNLDIYPSARSASSVISSGGVGSFNATALEKKLAGLRVSVSPFITERWEGFNGSASLADLETMMQLVYSYATAFRKDTVALNAYLSRERGTYANLLANPQNWYFDKVTRITSQNHPRRGFPDIESYNKVNMDDIARVYSERFADLSDMQFFFVGNFNLDSLKTLTSRYLGALPGNGRKEKGKDVGDRMPAGVIDSVFTRGEAPRSMVQLVYHGYNKFNTDSAYLLQSLIDLARIKLRESLREEESGVYGVDIFGGQAKYPVEQYTIRISFNAEPMRTNELVDAAKKVIMTMKDNISESDIAKVTEIQRQARVRDLQENQFWMSSMLTSYFNETDLAQQVEMQMLEKRISWLTKEQLLKAARKYFNEKEVISVVMLPKSKS